MNSQLAAEVKKHWTQLRGMTYDLIDLLEPADLGRKLPFERSQDIQYQFFCMLGTQESWPPLLTDGKMDGWSCSLNPVPVGEVQSIAKIRNHFQTADQHLFETLDKINLMRPFEEGGTPLSNYMRLVEHEAHHQGQLINFIFALDLPIPHSWADNWALSRDD